MLVTGLVPFDKTSPLDCWLKKTKNDIPSPQSIIPQLSDRVDFAIRRAMAPNAADRPASCREFMEDLTGLPWKAGQSSGMSNDSIHAPTEANTIWYMVYYDGDSNPKTVKGTTDTIRANALAGTLGDLNTTLVSRSKAGPFAPFKKVAEFRDLVLSGSDSLGGTSSTRLTNTQFTPPESGNASRHNQDVVETPSSLSARTPMKGVPAVTNRGTPHTSNPTSAELLERLQSSSAGNGSSTVTKRPTGTKPDQIIAVKNTPAAMATDTDEETVNLKPSNIATKAPFSEPARLNMPGWLPWVAVAVASGAIVGGLVALLM
jgi:hypothetical protein